MTGLVITVDWGRALLVAAAVFVPLGLLLHAGSWAGGWIGDRAGMAVANRIRARRERAVYLHPRRWS